MRLGVSGEGSENGGLRAGAPELEMKSCISVHPHDMKKGMGVLANARSAV